MCLYHSRLYIARTGDYEEMSLIQEGFDEQWNETIDTIVRGMIYDKIDIKEFRNLCEHGVSSVE